MDKEAKEILADIAKRVKTMETIMIASAVLAILAAIGYAVFLANSVLSG